MQYAAVHTLNGGLSQCKRPPFRNYLKIKYLTAVINPSANQLPTEISVFASTVAVALCPSVSTAFVPGMKIHGQRNMPVITASGVRFLPATRTVPVNGTFAPSASVTLFISTERRPLVPANDDFLASVTTPSANVPAGIRTSPPAFTSLTTLNLTLSPTSTSRAYTVLTDCNSTTVPVLTTAIWPCAKAQTGDTTSPKTRANLKKAFRIA